MKDEIVVKKVDLSEYDRLRNTIELRDNTIKYQQDQYLKLQKKVDCKEPLGLNYLLFTYAELIEILKKEYHPLHNYVYRWFGEDDENEGILYFSEDGIEVEQGDYWLVNTKKDIAMKFNNLDKLNRMIYKLDLDEVDDI